MKKYDKLIDYIFIEKGRYTDNGLSVPLSIGILVSEISEAIGKMYVFNLKEDKENASYMEKYIENRLDDECLYLDRYEEWYNNFGDIQIEEIDEDA
jgi:hypothetical protein